MEKINFKCECGEQQKREEFEIATKQEGKMIDFHFGRKFQDD